MNVEDFVQGMVAAQGPNYLQRQDELCERVRRNHAFTGSIFLFAACEEYNKRFVQDSTFYYYTGLDIPGAVLELSPQGDRVLYVPQFSDVRKKWVDSEHITEQVAKDLGYEYRGLGGKVAGLHLSYLHDQKPYTTLIKVLRDAVTSGLNVYTILPENKVGLKSLALLTILWLSQEVSGLREKLVDISMHVAHMREVKSKEEIEILYKALEITSAGHQAASHMIKPGAGESELQAAVEYLFTEYMAYPAYPTIVGSGKNATILHYDTNAAQLQQGETVLIDAGARFDYYAADITRVYPVETFTEKQKKVYQAVLDTQAYVVQHIRPGMWLYNEKEQEKSLHHIAMKFLQDAGYKDCCPHGIGHMLGLDVHDVHDRTRPLQAGNVITIEPGIYLPDQNVGVRIEDNYWVVDGDPVCLSEHIIKEIDDIEALVTQSFHKE